MEVAFKFHPRNGMDCSQSIPTLNLNSTKKPREPQKEALNNNMADAKGRSSDRETIEVATSAAASCFETRRLSKSDSKLKQTNFSIRCLLEEEIKSPSDSGYGSGSPSPNDSVFDADITSAYDESLKKDFSDSHQPQSPIPANQCEDSHKASSNFPQISNSKKNFFFPQDYQNILYAMNLQFLERQEKMSADAKINFNLEKRKELMRSTNSFKQLLPNESAINSHRDRDDENFLEALNKNISLDRLQNCDEKQNFFRTKSTNQEKLTSCSPNLKQKNDQDFVFNKNSKKLSCFEAVSSSSQSTSSARDGHNEYLQQMGRWWWENTLKKPGSATNPRLLHPLINSSYYHRLQMFLAASAAAAASGRFPCCSLKSSSNDLYSSPENNYDSLFRSSHTMSLKQEERKGKKFVSML